MIQGCFDFEKYLNQQELQVFIKPENQSREFLYFQHCGTAGTVIKALLGARRLKSSAFTCPVPAPAGRTDTVSSDLLMLSVPTTNDRIRWLIIRIIEY